MNTPELIYQTILFFFSSLWTYIGLIILILTIRGDISNGISSVNGFFKRVMLKFRERESKEKGFSEWKRGKKGLSREDDAIL